MINPVNSIGPVRLKAGGHLFHLHLELNWAAIQTLCLILTEQGRECSYSCSYLIRGPAARQGYEKLVYRLIQLFSSTEIFSKRRKIYAC